MALEAPILQQWLSGFRLTDVQREYLTTKQPICINLPPSSCDMSSWYVVWLVPVLFNSNNQRLKDPQNPFRWLIGYVFGCCSSAPCLRIGCHMKKLVSLSWWLFAPVICASASCNWCYLGSCLVDFHSDFCISTCHKPPMVDGIDWQQSRGLFSEALDAWPNLPPASAERRQLQMFFFESIEPLMQQVGVLLVFAYVCIFNLGDFF